MRITSQAIPPRFSGLNIRIQGFEQQEPSPLDLSNSEFTNDGIRHWTKQMEPHADFDVEIRPDGITGKAMFKDNSPELQLQSEKKEYWGAFVKRLLMEALLKVDPRSLQTFDAAFESPSQR